MSVLKTAILIPTVNEPTLGPVIEALKSQVQGNADIYVLGTGAAQKIASQYGVASIDLGQPRQKPVALNIALQQIRADRYIIFDADVFPEQGWYAAMTDEFERGTRIFSGSINQDKGGFWLQVYNLAFAHEFSSNKPRSIRKHLPANGLAFTADFLMRNGLFREDINRSEDYDWTLRASARGEQLVFTPLAVIDHLPADKNTFSSIMHAFFISGYDNWKVRNDFTDYLGTPFLLKSPLVILLLAPLLSLVPTFRIISTSPRLFFRKLYMIPFVYLLKISWCYGVYWYSRHSEKFYAL
jgi:cellulose synthase/poly-beta-1,6-N-acetylglucosamine synthase-like glycosyltransferase